jgi:DNA-binding NarL/FixJ family response regulator
MEELTAREREILRLVADGLRNAEVAQALDVSLKTVEFHLHQIFVKLEARSRTEAVKRAQKQGILAA